MPEQKGSPFREVLDHFAELQRMREHFRHPGEPTQPRSTAAALVADNALAPCMPLLEALAADAPATLQLTLGERMALNIQVGPA